MVAELWKKQKKLSIEFHILLGCSVAGIANKANPGKEKDGAQHSIHNDLLNVMRIGAPIHKIHTGQNKSYYTNQCQYNA